MKLKILNILSWIIYVLILCIIIHFSLIITMLIDIIRLFNNGILKYIFLLTYILAFVLPIIFRKKLKRFCLLPVSLIVAIILSVTVNTCIFLGVSGYMSDFSRAKWDKYHNLRICMVDDLENNYQLIGKSEKEIVELLGEPTDIAEHESKLYECYEYYIGDSIIDPYTFDVIFDNGIVIDTRIFEH